jgi:hypothetical protein
MKHHLSDKLTKDYGESIPNTQQAVYVLPLISAVIKSIDGQFASDLLVHIDSFKKALVKHFNGNYFHRAVFKNIFNQSIVITDLNLQAQVWPLITRMAKEMNIEDRLIATVRYRLDETTINGVALQSGGQVWPGISQLLTWSYIHCDYPTLAWRLLYKHTFANHADAFPSVWYNIWSGPDGIQSTDGSTWHSPVTPMTDFPVMNSNPHAMALFAILKVAVQLQPSLTGDGLTINLVHCKANLTLKLPLIQIRFNRTIGLTGVYSAYNDGNLNLYIIKPDSQSIKIPLKFRRGQQLPFQILFNSNIRSMDFLN